MLKPMIMAPLMGCVFLTSACSNMPFHHGTTNHSATNTINLTMLTDVTWQQILPGEINRPNIRFSSQDHRVSGSDGCNRLMGTYQADDQHLKLSPIASTRMACVSQDETLSRKFTDALSKTAAYRFENGNLILLDSENNRPLAKVVIASSSGLPVQRLS
ncbi:META domain-containing protein [Alkanindiges sp. WGS2144]|uniref:META domain-containing protein n=1 Tax=Alkanindiges sp. WGS2144 TaxID=3366808 RepID=UPI0037527073